MAVRPGKIYDAEAQFRLGCAYMDGKISEPKNEGEAIFGLPEDEKKAIFWWTKAGEQGHVEAQFKLGDFYDYGGEYIDYDKVKAAYWYGKAAEQGHGDAQNRLGFCYEWGEGVAKDKARAIYWYTRAAEQGYPGAQDNLRHAYGIEEDAADDEDKEVDW